MTWTITPPHVPGWYWFRGHPEHAAHIYRVEMGDHGPTVYTNRGDDWELSELVKYSTQPEWAGPIPEPVEARP